MVVKSMKVEHPGAIFTVGAGGKRRHYQHWNEAACFWWDVIAGSTPEVYKLPVCGRCAAMYPRGA